MSFPTWPPVEGGPRSVFAVDDERSWPVIDGRCDVGAVEELPPGSRRLVRLSGERSIGLFNVAGRLYAIRNVCPHKGAPLCRGRLRPHIVGQTAGDFTFEREGEIIKCPWHQWEFDLATGWSLYAPRLRVRTYPVTVEAGRLIVQVDD
jgi:nitrite reductase/ring-hydroxylating ferredoxin subunit